MDDGKFYSIFSGDSREEICEIAHCNYWRTCLHITSTRILNRIRRNEPLRSMAVDGIDVGKVVEATAMVIIAKGA